MSASLPEFVDRLVLDGTKVGYWPDRIAAWQRGERIAPVHVDCAMTRKCNAACHFCVSGTERILMADGTTKMMRDILVGDKIMSATPYFTIEPSIVRATWLTHPSKHIIKVKTNLGSISCTSDHQLLTVDGWKTAGSLTLEDCLVWKEIKNAETNCCPQKTAQETENGKANLCLEGENKSLLDCRAASAAIRAYSTLQQVDEWQNATRSDSKAGTWLEKVDGERCFSGNSEEAWGQIKGSQFNTRRISTTLRVDEETARRRNDRAAKAGRAAADRIASCQEEEEALQYESGGQGQSLGAYEESQSGGSYSGTSRGSGEKSEPHNTESPIRRDGAPDWTRLAEQDGSVIVEYNRADWFQICRGRSILDWSVQKQEVSESRLSVREREKQSSSFVPRKVLAHPKGCGRRRRNDRLSGSWMASSCCVGAGTEKHREIERHRLVVASVIGIDDAGSAAVYDLDCAPWHNFIAGGAIAQNCYAQIQASDGEEITKDIFLNFLSDAAEIGVKGVSFISDGESTVMPWWADAVEHAASVGLAVGAGSNGVKLTKPVLERTLKHLRFLRFNFSAGEKQRFAAIMGMPRHNYDVVLQNVRDGMEIIRRDNLDCSLNLQMVVHPDDADQIIPFAKLVAETKPVYGVLKHCADSWENHLGVDYSKYEAMKEDFRRAEEIGRDAGVRIAVKWSKLDGKRNYQRCMGPMFQMQVSGNGTVSTCGFHFNERFKKFHIGSICRERFRDIWASERYMEVMNYLKSDDFNAQNCGPNCLQNSTNEWLNAYVNGRVALPTTSPPPDLAFI